MGGAGGGAGLAAALLWAALAGAAGPEAPSHVLAEVLFCQPARPSLGLALTFDADQVFWFDFPGSRWTPRLSELPPWPPGLETSAQLLQDTAFCQELRSAITGLASGKVPEAKGVPMATVFPLQPPVLGEPNILVCLVENIFPPTVEITWELDRVPITQGVTQTHVTPTADLAFVRFSYLQVTPTLENIYTCVVSREGDNTSIVAYWVFHPLASSEEVETALCSAAMALGILLAIFGVTMVVVARRGTGGTVGG